MDHVDDSAWKEKPVMTDEDEGFLPRWSRRKLSERDAQGNTGAVADPVAPESKQVETTEAAVAQPRRELTDADMLPIDSLDEHSDYTTFMSPKVSDRLRAQALRKLFHLPAYNITDGLNDYDEDYTRFAGLGSMITHEMKRMLKRELEEREAAGELSEQEAALADVKTTDANDTDVTVTDDAAENDG